MPAEENPNTPEHKNEIAKQAKEASAQTAIAMELPFILVSAVLVGGLIGYFLDRWLHTRPLFLLILGGLGFFAGVRDVLRRLTGTSDGSKGS